MHQTQHSEGKAFFSKARQTLGSKIPKYQESQSECTLAFRCVLKRFKCEQQTEVQSF